MLLLPGGLGNKGREGRVLLKASLKTNNEPAADDNRLQPKYLRFVHYGQIVSIIGPVGSACAPAAASAAKAATGAAAHYSYGLCW
mgnify:CR=1 FL=1